jgi:hypothetical protein
MNLTNISVLNSALFLLWISIIIFFSMKLLLTNLWISDFAKKLIFNIIAFVCFWTFSMGYAFYLHEIKIVDIDNSSISLERSHR